MNELFDIRKKEDPKMLIGFIENFPKDYKLQQKIIILRCQLMAILKMFPVVHIAAKQDEVPEHTPIVTSENYKEITLDPEQKSVIINSVVCPLVDKPGRAFRNAEFLNAAKLSKSELEKHLIKVERKDGNIPDVKLEFQLDAKKKMLKCESYTSWTSDTIFAIGRKMYKNEFIPVSECEDDHFLLLEEIHVFSDTIPIKKNDETYYLPNKAFDHPLTMVCPTNPIYRCTTYDTQKKYLARPFPTEDDLKSMIHFCDETGNKGHLLFHNYGVPDQHKFGCYSSLSTKKRK